MPQNTYNAPVGVNYSNITAAGTTVVKAHPGTLFGYTINRGVSTGGVEILDAINGSGTVTVGNAVLGAAITTPEFVQYGPAGAGVNLNTGLVVITTGATIDVTIAYR